MSDSESENPNEVEEVEADNSPNNVTQSIEVIWDDDKIEKVSSLLTLDPCNYLYGRTSSPL
jgi:hypothetical protein